MRLSDDQIKEGLLHSDRELRTAIAYYYSRSFSSDPTIMPGVIRAIEQYGWADAFEAYNFLCELSQTEETVRWLIHQLQQYQPSDDERATRLRRDLQMALIHSDPLLLQKYEPQIKDLDSLDDEGRDAVDEQVSVPSESPAKLWTDLEELCELYSEDGSMPEDMFDFGGRLVKGLAQHQDVAERIGPILSDADQDENYWLTGFAIRLAGEMRLDTCVPRLVELGHDGDDWIKDEAFEALVKIGTADVVTQLAGDYSEADWEFRHATACYLENIHSDISVAMALRLFATEEDHGIRCSLLQSALMLFATEAIEPARQYVLISPKDPELLEVRHCLLLVCKLTGEQFPEFDAWLEDSKSDVEFRRQWYEDHPLRIGELDEFGDGDEVFDDDWEDGELADDLFADEADETSPVTFVRRGERIGRNDPCPCGSGKKYKNCCYRKGTADETDVNHAAAMSSVSQAQAPPKYPIGTVALYGPDDQRTTKIVAAVIRRYGDEPILQRWVGNKVKENPKVQRQIEEFFQKHVVKSVVASDGNMGCPHEEGEDFPMGEDCPFCPFWQGKQGTARRD